MANQMNDGRYLGLCWGCYECGDEVRIIGRFDDLDEAWRAVNGTDMGMSWTGDHEVIDLEQMVRTAPPGGN